MHPVPLANIDVTDSSKIAVLLLLFPYLGVLTGFNHSPTLTIIILMLPIAAAYFENEKLVWYCQSFLPSHYRRPSDKRASISVLVGTAGLALVGAAGIFCTPIILEKVGTTSPGLLKGFLLLCFLLLAFIQILLGYIILCRLVANPSLVQYTRHTNSVFVQILLCSLILVFGLAALEALRVFGLSQTDIGGELTLFGHFCVGFSLALAAIFCAFSYGHFCLSVLLCRKRLDRVDDDRGK